MADSMCGPSNGAKNLLAHVDRDRALHQDRLAASQPGPANAFRSQAPLSNGAEMAFGAFQQGGAPVDMTAGPNVLSGFSPVFSHANTPGAYLRSVSDTPAARLASPATGNTSHQEWVGQFAGMQLGPGAAAATGPSMANMHPAHPNHHAPAIAMQQQQHTPFSMPLYSPALSGFQSHAMGSMHPLATVQQQQQHQQHQLSPASALPDSAVAMDVEAFNRAFGEYDDANFESELADWTAQQQSLANTEFAEAQDQWMAEHGPQVDTTATTTTTVDTTTTTLKPDTEPNPQLEPTAVQPPTPAEMLAIDARLEQLAQEQERDRKRASDEELARAAASIVRSVEGNTSDKFRNSRFLELMRRIGNREVVVEGERFVDVATGEGVGGGEGEGQEREGEGEGGAGAGAGAGVDGGKKPTTTTTTTVPPTVNSAEGGNAI